jgi:uncharacterized protein YbjT (DUF2867 family)
VKGGREVVVTGGTGYIGRRLVPALIARGNRVRVLTRRESIARVPPGATPIIGNALDADSFSAWLSGRDTIVHLVGTPHPGPAKAREFQAVDLVSIRATVDAAGRAGASHLVYVSVAQPAPVMHAYLAARAAGEAAIAEAGLTATVLRPWYVLGPGHWWPVALLPLYGVAWLLPSARAGARRRGLVTLRQMVAALVDAVENPPPAGSVRLLDVPAIRRARASP